MVVSEVDARLRHAEFYARVELPKYAALYKAGGEVGKSTASAIKRRWGHYISARDWLSSNLYNNMHYFETATQISGHLLSYIISTQSLKTAIDWFEPILARWDNYVTQLSDNSDLSIMLTKICGHVANCHMRSGHQQVALRYTEMTERIAAISRETIATLLSQENWGTYFFNVYDFSAAKEHYSQALELANSLDDVEAQGRTLRHLGIICGSQGDFTQAVEYLEQALATLRACDDIRQQVSVLRSLAFTYSRMGKLDLEFSLLQEAYPLAEQIQDIMYQATIHLQLSQWYIRKGNYAQASHHAHLGEAFARQTNDVDLMISALGLPAQIAHLQHHYDEAFAAYSKILMLADATKHTQKIAVILSNIANGLTQFGMIDAGRIVCLASLQLAQENDFLFMIGRLHNSLAITEILEGNPQSATNRIVSWLEAYSEEPNKHLLLQTRAHAAYELTKLDIALVDAQSAQGLFEKGVSTQSQHTQQLLDFLRAEHKGSDVIPLIVALAEKLENIHLALALRYWKLALSYGADVNARITNLEMRISSYCEMVEEPLEQILHFCRNIN